MATSKPTITKITDSFTEFKDNLNRVSLDVGATGRLNTNQDSDLTSAINELELAIRGTSNDLVATDLSQMGMAANNIVSALHELDSDLHGDGGGNAKADLTTSAKDIVSAINEIEAVFDASTYEISAGTNAFDVTTGAYTHDASGNYDVNITGTADISASSTITLDANDDIILDANGADVVLKDDGTQYGALTNSSGNLVVKSGTSTVMTGSGTNATFNNNVDIDNDLTVDRDAQVTRDLNVDGITTVDSATVDGDLLVTDSAYIQSNLEVGGNVKIGNDKVNITASSGNTQIDGTLEVDGTSGVDGNFRVGSAGANKFNVTATSGNTSIAGTLAVTGQTDLNGHVNLGNASADNISIVGRVDTNIIPDADDTYDLGSSGLQWKDLYVDGVAYLDEIDADSAEIGNINIAGNQIDANGDLTLMSQVGDVILNAAGGDILLQDSGTQYGALTNNSDNLIIKSGSTTNLTMSGANLTTAGTVTTGGNITVGGTKINRTGALTLDVSSGISLDAGTGIVYLKDNNHTYGSFRNPAAKKTLDIYSGTTQAVVFDSSGGADFQDNLTVQGISYLDSAVVDGDLLVTDSAYIGDNLEVVGNLKIGNNKFNVTASSGNTQIDGNLNVDGVTTLDSATVDGDLTVTDSAYIVSNLDIGGNLDVDGQTQLDHLNVDGSTTLNGVTIDGTLDLNGSLDISQNLTVHGISTLDSAIVDGDLLVTDSAYIMSNLAVGGNTELDGTLGVDGNFRVGSDKFNVTATNGNTQIDGTLEVDGTAGVDGNFRVGSAGANKFNVTAASGNTQIDGTLDVDGNFEVGASKFNVTASSGNTQIDGTLEVDGTAGVDGNFRVGASGASKFDVVAASGNTTIDGVLAIANQDSDGLNGNLESSNVAISLYRLDSAIGNLASLSATDVSSHANIVSAINAVASDLSDATANSSTIDSKIGSLANLTDSDGDGSSGGFEGSERNSVVNALNALYFAIPEVYDDTGTRLN